MATDPYTSTRLHDTPSSRYWVCSKCERRETTALPTHALSHVCKSGPNQGKTTILTMIREGN